MSVNGGGGERRLIQLTAVNLLRSFIIHPAAFLMAIKLWHRTVGAVACKIEHCEASHGANRGMSNPLGLEHSGGRRRSQAAAGAH